MKKHLFLMMALMTFCNGYLHGIDPVPLAQAALMAEEADGYRGKDTTARDSLKKERPLKDIRRNSFYVENLVILFSVNYDRLIPLGRKTAIDIRGGLSYYANVFFIAGATFLYGKNGHFFEVGPGFDFESMKVGLYGQAGYRYMGEKGLLLKGGIQIVPNIPVFPYLGVGYSF